MNRLQDSCYGITEVAGASPLDFSYVFKDKEEVERLGMDVSTIRIRNDRGQITEFFVPESAAYAPGRVCAEAMWRLLSDQVGNRLLHTPTHLFGNVYVNHGLFGYVREQGGGYGQVNTSLPRVSHIADSVSLLCHDLLSNCSEQHTCWSLTTLCKDILEAHRKDRKIDPETYLEELLQGKR